MSTSPPNSKLETRNSKLLNRSPLLVIFITVFIDLVGFGIVIPVLPYYAEGTRFGATPREVGLLFASYSVMQLIFSPVLGRLSDKYGRRPVLLISLLGTSLGFFVMGFATTLWMLFLGTNHRRHFRRKYLNGPSLHRRRHDAGKSRERNGINRRGLRSRVRVWSGDRRHDEPLGHSCAVYVRGRRSHSLTQCCFTSCCRKR